MAYSEPCQTSKMELIAKIVNEFFSNVWKYKMSLQTHEKIAAVSSSKVQKSQLLNFAHFFIMKR